MITTCLTTMFVNRAPGEKVACLSLFSNTLYLLVFLSVYQFRFTSLLSVCSYPRRPWLHVDRLVEFGVLVKGFRVISRQVFVHNDGSVDGEFHFNYAGNLPLTVAPWNGSVPAKSSKIVKVSFTLTCFNNINNNITLRSNT